MKRRLPNEHVMAGSVTLLTLLVYSASLHNEFLQWDDDVYVFDNTFIRSFTGTLFRRAFFDFYASNWHPLTWLSHALDYAIWGLNPLGHHLTNIIFHAANTLLVVFIILQICSVVQKRARLSEESEFLTDRMKLVTAGAAGLLFGLHPLHVESAAWVAERKDLLCSFFFLLSIIYYTKYVISINNARMQPLSLLFIFNRQYLFSFGYFFLALLSKPMAVSLPVVLLILDWYPFERLNSLRTFRTTIVEKLPLISLSLLSSILTVIAQKSGGALKTLEFSSLSTRLLVGTKSLMAYLGKIMVPMNIMPYYPYPKNASLYSLEYSLSLIIVIGITVACIITAKKQKAWLTAWGYYIVTLVPVLGIVQVGNQAMADRYTYLPSIGPFVLIGFIIAVASKELNGLPRGWMFVTVGGRVMALMGIVLLMYLSFQQIRIRKNSIVFWNYVIDKTSQKMPFAYINRGVAYKKMGLTDKALEDYNRAITVDPSYYYAYNNRAIVLDERGQTDKALADYDKAIVLNPAFDMAYRAYNNRALIYEKKGLLDKALADYDKSVALNPSFDEVYYNRALIFEKMGHPDKAFADYDKAILLNPAFGKAYYNRALLFEKKGLIDRAVADYDRAIVVDPSFDKPYLARGILYSKAGMFDRAIEYISKFIIANPDNPEAFGTRGIAYALSNQFDRAMEDINKAIELNPGLAIAYANRGTIYGKLGNKKNARADFQKACRLGNEQACRTVQSLP